MHATSAQDTPGPAASPLLPPEVRAGFPGAQEKVYLDIALKGLIPRETAEAAHAHVEENLHASGSKDAQRGP